MNRACLLILLGLAACHPEPENRAHVRFFDLASFLSAERANLEGRQTVRKSVDLDGRSETREWPDYDWKAELDLLGQWDINKPAWSGMYTADTLVNGNRLTLRYTSEDKELSVRSQTIWMTGAKVDSLSIVTRIDNPLRTMDGTYRYVPGRELEIRQISRRRFGQARDLRIRLEVVPTSG